MFGRKYDPEEIADRLQSVVLGGTVHLAAYEQKVCPDEAEQTRIMLATQLFPIAASLTRAMTIKNDKLKAAITEGQVAYLNRFSDQDKLIRLGDYIIWHLERDKITRTLQEGYCQIVISSRFDIHQIPYGMLLRGLSSIRSSTFTSDFEHGMMQAQNDPKNSLKFAFISAATSFTLQVLKSDPGDPRFSEAQARRLQTSIAYASGLLGASFFKVIDMFQAIGA